MSDPSSLAARARDTIDGYEVRRVAQRHLFDLRLARGPSGRRPSSTSRVSEVLRRGSSSSSSSPVPVRSSCRSPSQVARSASTTQTSRRTRISAIENWPSDRQARRVSAAEGVGVNSSDAQDAGLCCSRHGHRPDEGGRYRTTKVEDHDHAFRIAGPERTRKPQPTALAFS